MFDVQKFHLHIDPMSIPSETRFEIADFLLSKLDLPSEELISFYEQFEKRSRNRLLKMWIEPEVREEILIWWRDYARLKSIPQNALFFVSDYQRSYPFGKMLGQVLHTVQTHLYVVISFSPIGPRACNFCVLIATSAPSPIWLPSVNRVEALT